MTVCRNSEVAALKLILPRTIQTELDLTAHSYIDWLQYDWLLSQGVPPDTMLSLVDLRVVKGFRTSLGFLEPDPDGKSFLAFEEYDDVIFWCPSTGELATWNGRAFALGQDNIINAVTYASGSSLCIHPNPLEWLRDKARGIVVLNWELTFDMLRDAPRVAVTEALLLTYKKRMRPGHLPQLSVRAMNRGIEA